MLFTGEYVHTIDAKQRLAIPAELRSKMVPELHGQSLYIAPGANGSLWLWPEKTFERMANAMDQSLLPDEEMMEFEELMFPLSRHLEIDSAGRVRIPEQMLREFGLGNTVIILGMRDHLELRDPAKWQAQRPQNPERQRNIMLRARSAMRRQKHIGHNSPASGGQEDGP